MNIAILGFAGQGISSYEYWNTPENQITICDVNTELTVPSGVQTQLGKDYLKNLDAFDLIVRTPSLHPREIVNANPESPDILSKVTTNTNEFFRVCPTENIVGVTGTKGKGTTSTLLTRMLEEVGKRVHLGGNIGTPPLELLKANIQADDWIVLELANFQLIDLKYSPHIAVCLMVMEEHLDWHEDMEEYIAAKQQLFIHQKSDDIAIYYAENEISESIAGASNGVHIPYYRQPGAYVKDDKVMIGDEVVCQVSELKLLGKHNWQNVCAAATAAWQVTHDFYALNRVTTDFTGLPFRIEFRAETNSIRYYNDSFATGQGATVAAIEAIPGSKVMIIGGFDRMITLDELPKALVAHQDEIRKVVLIGDSAIRTAQALKDHGYSNFIFCDAQTMPEVVAAATAQAQKGDAVVLSPAFASFDMFKNFEDRGVKFNEAVAAL